MDSSNDQEPNYLVDLNSYRILEKLGRGKNTIIYRAFCDPMNTDVVIKSIFLDNCFLTVLDHSDSTIPTPILNHPNILNSHCTFLASENIVWVVMPLMSAGSLQSIMSLSFPTGLPEDYIAIFLKPILNLLSYLQEMKVPHIELKAGNILIDHKGTFKFSDFDLWHSSQLKHIQNVTCKPYWVAPELVESYDAYSVKSEIWSFGILALELAHGKPPLFDIVLPKSLNKMIKQRFSFAKFNESNSEKIFSESFKSLVKSCLKRNPAKRPTLNMLLNHPFFFERSTDYLMDKMLKDLPPMVNRFGVYSALRDEEGYEEGEGESEQEHDEEWNVIYGWNLDVDTLKLFPCHSIENQVEEEDEYLECAKLEGVNVKLHEVIKQLDEVGWISSKPDFLSTLFTVRRTLQEQINRIISLFNSNGGVLREVPFYDPSLDEHNVKEDDA